MNPTPDDHSLDPSLAALEYLLGDARGESVEFEQQLLNDPSACDCLADLVLVQQAATSIRDAVAPVVTSQPVSVQAGHNPSRIPGWVTMLGGLAAMLLVGLWIGYEWGDRQDGSRTDSGMANDTTSSGPSTGSPIVWHSELINTWSDLSGSTIENDSTLSEELSEDELDAAYAAASPTEWNTESPVPDWMWTAVSISAMDEARELHEDNEFEFEETL